MKIIAICYRKNSINSALHQRVVFIKPYHSCLTFTALGLSAKKRLRISKVFQLHVNFTHSRLQPMFNCFSFNTTLR